MKDYHYLKKKIKFYSLKIQANYSLMFMLLVFSVTTTMAQQTIKGTITDNNGQPLPGANVLEKGTSNGAQSDFDGNFSFNVTDENATLIVSYIGFLTNEVSINGQTTLTIVLEEDSALLDEVVIIGYGSVKKSDLTGSVTSVSSKDFNKGVVNNADQLFQGKAAGVNLTQTSAQPGGITKLRIRGATSINASNSPLYVIDGLPIDNINASDNDLGSVLAPPPGNPLNTLNPNDIESIEILKDASSTAIYGSRGANGVVIITTKKGTGKTSVSYNSSVSVQTIAKEYDLPSAFEYATFFNEYFDFKTATVPGDNDLVGITKYSPTQLAAFQNGEGTTDWFNVLTRTGLIKNHQISVSSGGEKGSIYSSINYMEHEGVLENSDLERVSARLNAVHKVNGSLEFGTNISISNVSSENVAYGGAFADRGGALSGVFGWAPTIPVLNADGTLSNHPESTNTFNPFANSLVDNNSTVDRILATTYVEATLFDGFKAKVLYGYDKTLSKNRAYIPSTAKSALAPAGEATIGTFQIDNKLIDFILSYDKELGNHKINAVGAASKQVRGYESSTSRANGFTTDAFLYNNLSAATNQLTNSNKSESTIVSFLSRVNYSFKNRYLFTFSGRYDGSSKFDEGSKWGFFPSGAFAWKAINEPFFNNQDVLSDLKLRVSYGEVGNQEIGTNQSQPLIGTRGGGTPISGVIGNVPVTPFEPLSPGSPGLTWETTKQTNVGLDLGFLSGRLNLTMDYYNILTEDVLLNFNTPTTSGFGSVVKNAGAIRNKGFEFSAKSINTTGEFGWETSFNIAFNETNWDDRAGLPFGIADEKGPVRAIYGYQIDGIWQPGDDLTIYPDGDAVVGTYRFKDINGRDANNELTGQPDGNVTSDDRVLIGNTEPGVIAGLTNTFTYKNFSLNVFFNGMFDFVIYNQAAERLSNPSRVLKREGIGNLAFNYWSPNNSNGNVANGLANTKGGSVNDRFVEKGDFIRLQNVTLNYQVPLKVDWINSLTLGLSAQNLFVITDYTGLDPETASPSFGNGSFVQRGGEQEVYPNARTYSLSLNVNF